MLWGRLARSASWAILGTALACGSGVDRRFGAGGSGGAGGDLETVASASVGASATASTGATVGTGGTGGACADVCCGQSSVVASGDYLLTLSAKISPKKPVVFIAKLTSPPEGMSFSVGLQPVLAADRKTPTGPPISGGPFAVASDGGFTADFEAITIPGDANPITPGSPIEASAKLSGFLCKDTSFVCGDVTGTITKPLPLSLDGSTFAMERVTDASRYPEPPQIDCAGDLADPLQ